MPVAAIPTRGFPAFLIPPLAATIALIVTTAYGVVYELVDLGSIGPLDWFLTNAAPNVLHSPFFSYTSFGGDWAIAIPFFALLLTTMLLTSLTKTDIVQRLAIGALVFVPMVLFTALLILLNYAIVGADTYDLVYAGIGEPLAKGCAGAAIVGLLGGLLGALLSLAIRPPARSTGWG